MVKKSFTVGTDEHGEKIAESAKHAIFLPNNLWMRCRLNSEAHVALISYDRCVRTTDADHVKAAQHFSVCGTTMTFTPTCTKDGVFRTKRWTKDTVEKLGKRFCEYALRKGIEKVKRKVIFQMGAKKLEEWYAQTHEMFSRFKKKEMENFLKQGLHDVSFSRKSIRWGIPTPVNPGTRCAWSMPS